MRKCKICGEPLGPLPFHCAYCGHDFCAEHRLPEYHSCTGNYKRKIYHG